MGKMYQLLQLLWILPLIQGSPLLLFANRKDVRLVDAGDGRSDATVVVGNLEDAAALDFHYASRSVFWADVTLEMIKRTWVNETGRVVDVITTGLVSPDGLACDWLGNKLYWTDSETNRIEVADLDGSNRKVLFWENLDQPRAIALDPLHGYMYWTDWGEMPKIERAGMNGDRATRNIIIRDNIYWPNGLTLDYDAEKIYWADAKLSFIHSCEFDGSNRQVIVDTELPHPFALTLFGDSLYWTDWSNRAIDSCDKLSGEDRRVVHSNIHSPMDIHVFHAQRQPNGVNPCAGDNGGCSHLCLMAPYPPYYTCSCPTGVQLRADNKTCAQGAKEILLLVRRRDIRRISLDTPDYTAVVLQFNDIQHAIAVDYDPVEGYMYWTDDQVKSIQRGFLDGTGQETILSTEVDHPDGIAVDWVARNIYWTDTGTDRIEVARLNGTSRKVLVSEQLDEPRAIVLDPMAGYMYWTDWGTNNPKIERALMDGSDREVLINTSLSWPNGLALDFIERKMYWGDGSTDRIETANMDGTGRRVIVSQDLPHIFGFSLLGDYIYWTDWQRRSIERVNKHTGGERTVIIEQLPDLMGLKATTRVYKGSETDFRDNPCHQNNGGCSHLCLNRPLPKGAVCACPMGLEIQADGKTCIVPDAFLLFTRRTDICRISLERNHNDLTIPLAGVEEASALDFDINDNRIYWTDVSQQMISRAFMNGSALEHVVQFGLQFPEGMAVDWVSQNLYWADEGKHRIEMARVDGSARRVLLWKDIDPRSIALDPPKGYMYWTNWGQVTKLERANLDGTGREMLVRDVGRANSLTIDYIDRRLYWTNLDTSFIESCDMFGEDRRIIINEDVPSPYGLTQYQDYIYWSDWETRSIERANKTDGLNRTRIQGDMDLIMALLVYHASRQSGWNTCQAANGGCSHICIAHSQTYPSNYTHHCACPTHYSLGSDNRTCSSPGSFILFTQHKNVISRMLTDTEEEPDLILPIQGLRNIKGLAYDPVDRYIYWIDGRSKTIKRSLENGTNGDTVVPNPQSEEFNPYDIEVDPHSRLLYWSDSLNNVINVTRLDMRGVGVVIQGDRQKPRSIALAPQQGLLFWVNLAKPPSIERASMDGMSRITPITSGLDDPGELTIDPRTRKIFWADNGLKRIEYADFDGGNRKVLISGEIQPTSLAVLGPYLYWIDREHIERINIITGQDRVHIKNRVPNMRDIIAVDEFSLDDHYSHPCSINNGGCTHLCYAKPNGNAGCSCPVNLALTKDDRTCAEPPTCAADQFTCTSGGSEECIPHVWHCDGYNDCEDASDELGCPSCGTNQFKCRDQSCVSSKKRCDGIPHCNDGSDEEGCAPCSNKQFKCEVDNTCISSALVCDFKPDCSDGEDEYHCPDPYGRLIQQRQETTAAEFTIGIVITVVVVLIVLVFVIFACRHKNQQRPENGDIIMVTKPLNPKASQSHSQTTPPHTLSSRGKSGITCMTLSSVPNGILAPPLYERAPVTGASSSSSAISHYPKETLNPPPSPVTSDQSQCTAGDFYCMSESTAPSTILPYRPRPPPHRHRHHVPPRHTTPCSTDVCEDSESEALQGRYYNSLADQGYDSDIISPPPPTPRSQYFSDDMSCPPSPSTVRSFCNPYPPPPSPVGTSDC